MARIKTLEPQIADLFRLGYTARLVTLTLQHYAGDDPAVLFTALRDAWAKTTEGKAWDQFRKVGGLSLQYIRGVDWTWSSEAGWHPHLHIVLLFPPGHSCNVEWFIGRWMDALESFGFYASRRGQHSGWAQGGSNGGSRHTDRPTTEELVGPLDAAIDDAMKAAGYAGATWVPSAEAVGSALKRSRTDGSFSPFELLAKAASGEAWARALWRSYVDATKGKRQTTTSRGLRLCKDDDLVLADDVAAVSPAAVAEIEQTPSVHRDLLIAAANPDVEVRRFAVETVLSRLVSTDWRMLPVVVPAPPDIGFDALVAQAEASFGCPDPDADADPDDGEWSAEQQDADDEADAAAWIAICRAEVENRFLPH